MTHKTHLFSPVDRQQAWFKKLQDSLNERLDKLREQNDRSMNADETEKLRGRIDELKRLLSDMDEPTPPQQPRKRPNY